MEDLGGAWVKGCTLCYVARWFLPQDGILSGTPEHHGGGGEHKAGLTECMQLPLTCVRGKMS